MTLADRIRQALIGIDGPFYTRDILPLVEGSHSKINQVLHGLSASGEITGSLVPFGNGNINRWQKTEQLKLPGAAARVGNRAARADIGDPEAALRLQDALSRISGGHYKTGTFLSCA